MTSALLRSRGRTAVARRTLAEELAEVLEDRAMAHAAIDLDLADVVRRARAERRRAGRGLPREPRSRGRELPHGGRPIPRAGWRRRSQADLAEIREAVGHPVQVIRLIVPLEEIERRSALGRRPAASGTSRRVAGRAGRPGSPLVTSSGPRSRRTTRELRPAARDQGPGRTPSAASPLTSGVPLTSPPTAERLRRVEHPSRYRHQPLNAFGPSAS